MAIRPRHLAAGFGAYIVVVAWFAWQTSQATQSGWYDADISLWTYGFNFLGALALGGGLVAAGAAAGRGSVDLDALRGKLAAVRSRLVALEVHTRGEVNEDEVETLLASLEDDPETHASPPGASVEALVAEIEQLLPGNETPRLAGARGNPRRKAALGTMAGPVGACAGLAAISAAMLPASSGFLQTNFALNTFFVLTIAYGWIGLLGYVLGSAFLVLRRR